MKKILIVFGTRPEAIKLLPIIWQMRSKHIAYELLNTNQHAAILDKMLEEEKIIPEYRLSICGKYQHLVEIKSAILHQMNEILPINQFSHVIVQGDTLSAWTGAEYGFLHQLPVYHVEAGMRTYHPENPYPEESFRRMITIMSAKHFCPSSDEQANLLKEGVPEENIYIVGNTFADYRKRFNANIEERRQILITLHRRENLPYLDSIAKQIAVLAEENPEYTWLFPVHPNPVITDTITKHLHQLKNIKLCTPLSPDEFYRELLASELIISDSGGVQEECIFNAKKILIIREVSERRTNFEFTEIIPPTENFKDKFYLLLNRRTKREIINYYGTGNAAEQIVKIILKEGF